MQAASPIRRALNGGFTTFGGWQMFSGTYISRFMARSGLDWICVDTEHGNIDDSQMHEAVTAIAATQTCSPIVRIPAIESWMVKRALDAGAHGVMVPLLRTADEAKRLVESAKFPPVGKRGFGSPFSPHSFAVTQADGATGKVTANFPTLVGYLQQANSTLLTIVQIETKEALENIDDIAAVPGIDVLFVGPFDLGNNIGHPILGEQAPELKQAIEKIRVAAKNAGKWSGIYCTGGEQARNAAAQGFDMISITGDTDAINLHFRQNLAAAKGSA